MQKQEWESLAGITASEEEWEIVETVYMNHPAISNAKGKTQMLELFKMGGMGLLKEMYQVAAEVSDYEREIRLHQEAIRRAENFILQIKARYQAQTGRE